MNRRRFLAGLGGIGLIGTAGYAAIGGSRTLSNPTVEREADGETHLRFRADDERVATLTVSPGRRYSGAGGGGVPVDVSIAHREGTAITSLALELRTLAPGGNPPAQVALTTPWGTPHPALQLYTDPRDGGTILEVAEMGGQGRGTTTFEFLLTGVDASTSELEVDATADLAASNALEGGYTLEGRTLVHLPKGTAHESGR